MLSGYSAQWREFYREPTTAAALAAQESAAARDLDPCADMSVLAWLYEERG